MRADVDSLVLDWVFQPMSDRAARWTTCFGLARLSLVAALVLQLVILAIDLGSLGAPVQRGAAGIITVLALFGGQQAWSLIARTERQTRPGGQNLRRVTLRWQRWAWLAVTAWSATSLITSLITSLWGEAALALCGASLAWLFLIYFVSCTPPPERTESRQALTSPG